MRVKEHPILGRVRLGKRVKIRVDGKIFEAIEGEPIAAALMASGVKVFRRTRKRKEPRGVFCAIGRCTDCIMTVDDVPNVRTCVTPVRNGMKIQSERS